MKRFFRVPSAPDDNGRFFIIKDGPGTLHLLLNGRSGDFSVGNTFGGNIFFTIYDGTAVNTDVISSLGLVDAQHVPLNVDFKNGLSIFIRQPVGTGALTVIFD